MTAVDVAIVGGGFTGALVAWHLARQAPGTRIAVIEPRARLGAGLAYSTADPSHRINVPASRMTMRTDIRDGLNRWIAAQDATLADDGAGPCGTLFPQRGLVADYVAAALRPDLIAGRIRHIRSRATALSAQAGTFRVTLANGTPIRAPQVVIATSHPPPALPRDLAALGNDPRLIADPSDAAAITAAAAARRVLILGNGLTSADVIASLDRQGFRGAILALSRRGLRSRGHAFGHAQSPADFAIDPAATALTLLRRVRAAVRADAAAGLPWQATLDNLRRDGPAVWAALPLRERERLVARLRVWWDVHRFRIAPQVEQVLDRLVAADRLRVRAGRLATIRPDPAGLIVTWSPRGQKPRTGVFDRVILTTGPAHGRIIQTSPVLASGADAGLLRADPLGLGLDVTSGCRAVGGNGRIVPGLWVAGPLARGHVGELMGIPEVTAHAELVASRLAETIRAGQRVAAGT